MAKIIFSNGSEIRGTIGGNTYSRNASGAYVRGYVKPVNKNTAKQQSVRNVFASVAQGWRSLSAANRQTYADMCQFYPKTDSVGNVVIPTPSQLFARINGGLYQNGVLANGTFLTTCPAPVSMLNPLSLSPEYDSGTNDFTAAVEFEPSNFTVPANSILRLEATPSISAGIKSVPKKTFSRIATLVTGDNTSTEDIKSAYEAVYGSINTQMNFYIKATLINTQTGQTSVSLVAPVAFV
jgi:hypothetical protein